MKLSTRSRYGVRLMYELAVHHGEAPVIIKDIASRQNISEKYLSKIIMLLKSAHLVNSARGSHGGYTLSRDPSKINLREIVETLEGDITPVDCVKNIALCERSINCPTRDVWCGLDKAISGFLEGITLDKLVKNVSGDNEAFGYCI